MQAAWDCGLRAVGENKVQEALSKMDEVQVPIAWHLIGHLQRNKAKFTPRFALVQSMDSPRLADALHDVGVREGTVIRVLAQVNASGEESKGGYAVDAVRADAPPASVIRLADAQVPALFRNRFSPHQLGVADLLATLVLTDETPRSITLIGVVPVDLALGLELSPEVALAAERALECLVAELRGRGFKLELRAPASASTA